MGYKIPKLVAQHCSVSSRCFSFFTLQDQLAMQQKHLLQVEEMQHADWLICLVGIQDGSIATNLLRDKLRVG